MNDQAALRRDPNFRWLMSGGMISALGDQFSMIALPWLVLLLTGDPLALGLMVAVMGIPRAILILFGGAVVDRYSPQRVLMLSKHANTLLLAILAALVLSGKATLLPVALLAVALSLASAFSIPAGTSMLPHALAPRHLAAANGAMLAMRQLTMLAGPLLAGLLFALGGDGSAGMGDARGLGLAFAFDAFSFALSAWTLSRVRPLAQPAARSAPEPVLRAVGAGLATVWRDLTLRAAFLYWGLCACVVGGVMQVALPLLASERLHGAAGLALLMGAHGTGALAGMGLSGVLGKRRVVNLGVTLLLVDGLVGLLLAPIGVLGGFVQVAVFTWVQQSVPQAMLGRMMGIFMFVFMGLAPLAAAAAGWLASLLSLDMLFAASGLSLTAAALLAWLFTPMATLSDAQAPDAARPDAARPDAARPEAGAGIG